MWAVRLLLVVMVLPVAPGGARAQGLDRESIALVRETADSICGEILREGSNRELEIEGELNAELRGLARRLADAGIEGGARLEDGRYANVLRDELGAELQSARDCRIKVFDKLIDRLDSAPSSDSRSGLDADMPLPDGPQSDGGGSAAELAGLVIWGPYINCSVYNAEPWDVQVTSINYLLQGLFGAQPVSYPCTFNCGILGYNSSVFSGPPNNPGVTTGSCWVTAMR